MEFKRNIKIYIDENSDIYHEFDRVSQLEENCLFSAATALQVYLNNNHIPYDYNRAEAFFKDIYVFAHHEYYDDEILNEKIDELINWYFKPEKVINKVEVTITKTFVVNVETDKEEDDYTVKMLARNLMKNPENQLNKKESINYKILN